MSKKTYTFLEMLELLKQGKKVRKLTWYKNVYIQYSSWNDRGVCLHNSYGTICQINVKPSLDDMMYDEWVIYE
jgi:hypothetical protein